MTPEQIAEIRARAEATTPGPWRARDAEFFQHIILGPGPTDELGESRPQVVAATQNVGWRSNAEFIAHARTDVPALLDALDAAEATVARVRGLVEDWFPTSGDLVPPLPPSAAWELCRERIEALGAALDGGGS